MKRIALLASVFVAGTIAVATPLPTVVDETVSLDTGRTQSYPAHFADRSSNKLMILLEPALDFHSEEGRKIKWGGRIDFTITITAAGRVVLEEHRKEKIDHATGLWNRRIRVPEDIPSDANATIEVVVEYIDPDLKAVYVRGRLVMNRFPHNSSLD